MGSKPQRVYTGIQLESVSQLNKYTLSYRFLNGNVHGCVFAKNRPVSTNWSDYINCTCRHNISREIYFCTNPTHWRLSKMVGRKVENEIEIRADIKTRALLSRGSADIYADICTVYVSSSMSFSTVCRQVRDRSVQA